MKTMLLFTPQWIPTLPPLGLPSLTAFLRTRGYEVVQRDINAECYDILLSRDYLLNIGERLSLMTRELGSRTYLTPAEQRDYESLFTLGSLAPVVAEAIDTAKRVYRSDEFYDIQKLAESRTMIQKACNLISRVYAPTIIDLSWFEMGRLEESVAGLEKATIDRSINPFIEIYENHILPTILQDRPDIIGLSILSTNQLIPGLTLARMIRERQPGIHIVAGGSVITQLGESLSRLDVLFREYVSSCVLHEGEYPLLKLVEALASGQSLETVPNLVYHDEQGIRTNGIRPPADIDSLPTPDYDGLPLERYLTPEPVLSLLSSRGCYWGKCAFCFHGIIYQSRYRVRNSIKVVDDIEHLHRKYGATHFAFSDEAISPHGFEGISDQIILRGLNIRCLADARIDRGLTDRLCRKMARAGFKTLYFGMESGCQRVLDHMEKGIDRQAIIEISKNVTRAGIWNHMFSFFGFPTETREEAQETLDLLFLHRDIIRSFSITYFQLGKDSPAANDPERYGITRIYRDPMREMQFMFRYEAPGGMSQREAIHLSTASMERMVREFPTGMVIENLGFDNLLLYLSRFEKEDPLLEGIEFSAGGTRTGGRAGKIKTVHPDSMPLLKEGLKVQSLTYDLVDIRRRIRTGERGPVHPRPIFVVYHPGTGRIVSIDLSGKRILDLCDGQTTVRSIASGLARHYGIPHRVIEQDCVEFLGKLAAEEMINPGGEERCGSRSPADWPDPR